MSGLHGISDSGHLLVALLQLRHEVPNFGYILQRHQLCYYKSSQVSETDVTDSSLALQGRHNLHAVQVCSRAALLP